MPPPTEVVLVLHLLATVMMAGLIWFVQIVHYPLFRAVGTEAFVAYEREHVRRTGWVVGPMMLVEAATAVWLAVRPGGGLAWSGLGLLTLIWASTFFVQVPIHRRLEGGHDVHLFERLVRSNRWRTVGWSARALLAVALLLQGTSPA